nr:MAG TPA: hypothetical protein [Caudoviricetes sp.]
MPNPMMFLRCLLETLLCKYCSLSLATSRNYWL